MNPRLLAPRSNLLFMACVVAISTAAQAQIASSVTLTPGANPTNYGQLVTLTASVTAGATGKVTFYDGVSILGTSAISAGQAVFATALLPSGIRSVHAHYS